MSCHRVGRFRGHQHLSIPDEHFHLAVKLSDNRLSLSVVVIYIYRCARRGWRRFRPRPVRFPCFPSFSGPHPVSASRNAIRTIHPRNFSRSRNRSKRRYARSIVSCATSSASASWCRTLRATRYASPLHSPIRSSNSRARAAWASRRASSTLAFPSGWTRTSSRIPSSPYFCQTPRSGDWFTATAVNHSSTAFRIMRSLACNPKPQLPIPIRNSRSIRDSRTGRQWAQWATNPGAAEIQSRPPNRISSATSLSLQNTYLLRSRKNHSECLLSPTFPSLALRLLPAWPCAPPRDSFLRTAAANDRCRFFFLRWV
jgi:hypothetical protein